ncbi:MAG: hypothetical protein AB7F86_09055 [Bdellovibrionales bacterium]
MQAVITLILMLVSAGGTYYGLQYTGQLEKNKACGPVALTPEVRNYIDAKFAAGFGSQMSDFQTIGAKVGEMEGKIGEIEKLKDYYDGLNKRNENIELALIEQRKKQTDRMITAQQAELNQLRGQVSAMCAGLRVQRAIPGLRRRRGENGTATPNGRNGSQFMQNLGAGSGGGGSVSSGGRRGNGKGSGGRGGKGGGGQRKRQGSGG